MRPNLGPNLRAKKQTARVAGATRAVMNWRPCAAVAWASVHRRPGRSTIDQNIRKVTVAGGSLISAESKTLRAIAAAGHVGSGQVQGHGALGWVDRLRCCNDCLMTTGLRK